MRTLVATRRARQDHPGEAPGSILCGLRTGWILVPILGVACALGAEGPSDNPGAGGGPARRPLWQIAIERMREQGGYVAANVETDLQVFDGDEKLLGTVTEAERMERSGDTIRWLTRSKNKSGSPGMTIKADFGLQSNPASALEGYDQWRRRGTGEFPGRPIEVWEGSTGADPQNRIVAYIDATTGSLRRAEFTMPFRSPVGSLIVKGELTCQRLSGDVWLPSRITMDQTGRFFFIKRHLHLVKTYTGWQPRVERTLSAIPRAKTDE